MPESEPSQGQPAEKQPSETDPNQSVEEYVEDVENDPAANPQDPEMERFRGG